MQEWHLVCVSFFVCLFLPCVTVAVRAEPHHSVLVGNPDAMQGVGTHHQEEVKHLNNTVENEKKSIPKERKLCKLKMSSKVNGLVFTCSLTAEAIAEQYLFL